MTATIMGAGYGSESEVDDEVATVSLATDLGRVNRASNKSVVKLQEIGPRLTLQLIKIEEGLYSGGVIFSEYGNHGSSENQKTDDEEQENEEDEDGEQENEEEEEQDNVEKVA